MRSLARSPGFTVLAIITLALGIGANTAMFSVLNSIMLKSLPYPNRAELDRFYRATPQNPLGGFSPADYLDLRREVASYGEVAAYTPSDTSLSRARAASRDGVRDPRERQSPFHTRRPT